VSNPVPLDYDELRLGYHKNAEARREARETLLDQLKKKAEAECEYRKALSVAFTKYRGKGSGAGEAEIHARADAARHALDRDIAEARAKASTARLQELEAERASLRQLGDWAQRET